MSMSQHSMPHNGESTLPPPASAGKLVLYPDPDDVTTGQKIEHATATVLQMVGQGAMIMVLPVIGFAAFTLMSMKEKQVELTTEFRVVRTEVASMRSFVEAQSTKAIDFARDSDIIKLQLVSLRDRLERLERSTVHTTAASPIRRAQ